MNIGIDLGTTYSAAAYVDNTGHAQIISNSEGQRTTPSVVLFEDDGVCVGEQAKQNSIIDPLRVCQFVKRQMGTPYKFIDPNDKEYTAEEISAIILKKIKADCEDALGEPVTGAVITVPAYFDDSQRTATQDAGKMAGLDVKGIINEPTAAAIAFCHHNDIQNMNVMVFDLGGGTFDVTIVHMNSEKDIDIVATNGHKNLGGFDFDNQIMNRVVEEFEKQTGQDLYDHESLMQDVREKCENLKKTLSTKEKGKIAFSFEGKPITVELTRDEFKKMIKSYLNNAQSIMEVVLEDAKLTWKDIDKVLLVGGSTRVPAMQEMIEEVTGIKPSHEINPDEAVALGAAYYASSLDDSKSYKEKEYKVTDVCSHSLGVIANDDTGRPANTIMIKRNTKIPCEASDSFTTTVDNQESVIVQLVEGEEADLDYCTLVGQSTIMLRPHPVGSPIEIVLQYDINGVIHVRVRDLLDNVDLGEFNIERKANLTDEELKNKKENINNIEII